MRGLKRLKMTKEIKYVLDFERPNGLHWQLPDKSEGKTFTEITGDTIFFILEEAQQRFSDCHITVYEFREVLTIHATK